MSKGTASLIAHPVLVGGFAFGLGLGLFFWWAAGDPAFGAYAGVFGGGVFSWRMTRLFGVSRS